MRSRTILPRGVLLDALGGRGIAGVPQGEAQHVKELYAVHEYWLRVVVCEEVTVNACNPKAVPLVEGKLMAKSPGTYLDLACTRFAKETNDPFQKRRAMARFLVCRLHSDAHWLVCASTKWPDHACANDHPPLDATKHFNLGRYERTLSSEGSASSSRSIGTSVVGVS